VPFTAGRTAIEVAFTAPVSSDAPSAVTHVPTVAALAVAVTVRV
jgi:hypothetical protein